MLKSPKSSSKSNSKEKVREALVLPRVRFHSAGVNGRAYTNLPSGMGKS
jgi:hypothetical protein